MRAGEREGGGEGEQAGEEESEIGRGREKYSLLLLVVDRCIIEVPSNESIPTQMCNGKDACTYKFKLSYTKTCPMIQSIKTTYQQIRYDCVKSKGPYSQH